jgi:triosephosphate isomerase (TIM)
MRKPIVIGNWKMNKTAEQATLLIADLLPEMKTIQQVDRIVCPPFTALMVVSQMLDNTGIGVGAQDLHWENAGAFTGEIAPSMVKEFCQSVIIGHSERRSYFGETDESVNRKVKAALANGLVPVMCIGETLSENESGMTQKVVERQLKNGLKDISSEQVATLMIAYEPVWAIGTGRAATKEDAQKVIGGIIRNQLVSVFGGEIGQKVRILYGGSVNSQNAAEYFQMPDIDGALVGGASLKAPDFLGIVKAAIK